MKRYRQPETYVGDDFLLSFIRADKDPLSIYDGYQGKLIGFNNKVVPILRHQINRYTKEPGIYKTLGDPILKLETGSLVKVPILNLSPIGYSFEDRIEKNINYQNEIKKFVYLQGLPFISYNIGDKVLVAKHGRLSRDLQSHIVDIVVAGRGIRYVIYQDDTLLEIPSEYIIDVLELGEYSEHERELKQMRTIDRMINRRCSGIRYIDGDLFE